MIQSVNLLTLVYTPGWWGSLHPMPQERMPASWYLACLAWLSCSTTRGPPLSPSQVSFLPSE